jgi:two-component sensor histidine kinase
MLRETVSRLEQAERTKAILLEELAHRTKNDLSIISSAITLQAQATANPDVRHALETANARVLVIASAQERLRGDIDGGRLDLAGYLEELCRDLGNMLRDVRPIAVRVKCEPMDVANSVAVHVGLIVNELVTNAFKYAYPDDRSGTVNVEIKAQENGLAITVTDDGVGCPADVPSGLGTRLVRLLVQQRGGTFRREPANPGCRAQVMLADMV